MEEQKRREYEEWFKTQQKEALEYSSTVEYKESKEINVSHSHLTTTSATLESRVSIERSINGHNDTLVQDNSYLEETYHNGSDEVDDSMQRLENLSVSQQPPYRGDGRI